MLGRILSLFKTEVSPECNRILSLLDIKDAGEWELVKERQPYGIRRGDHLLIPSPGWPAEYLNDVRVQVFVKGYDVSAAFSEDEHREMWHAADRIRGRYVSEWKRDYDQRKKAEAILLLKALSKNTERSSIDGHAV